MTTTKGYSTKQAGVVYRAYKQGRIELTREAVSYMYDHVNMSVEWDGWTIMEVLEDWFLAVKDAVDAIFADDDERLARAAADMCRMAA